MRAAVEPGERLLHGLTHAHLVDVAHVEHLEPLLVEEALLAGIDAAHAELADPRGFERRRGTAEPGERGRPEAAQAGERHAMDIAARGELARVEIGMRVEPQHPQLPALLAAIPRDRADRADTERMIAAEEHRQPLLLELRVHRLVHQLVPAHHLRQMPVAVFGRLPGIAGSVEVAEVEHLELPLAQRPGESRHPQRFRPHRRAAIRRADIRRRADEGRHARAAHAATPR